MERGMGRAVLASFLDDTKSAEIALEEQNAAAQKALQEENAAAEKKLNEEIASSELKIEETRAANNKKLEELKAHNEKKVRIAADSSSAFSLDEETNMEPPPIEEAPEPLTNAPELRFPEKAPEPFTNATELPSPELRFPEKAPEPFTETTESPPPQVVVSANQVTMDPMPSPEKAVWRRDEYLTAMCACATIFFALLLIVFLLEKDEGPCFENTKSLREGIIEYVEDSSSNTEVAQVHGWPMNAWCISKVTNFDSLFLSLYDEAGDAVNVVTEDLTDWDTKEVVSMYRTFWGTDNFNPLIDTWNTGAVKNMSEAFALTKEMNPDISRWDVRNVEDMSGAFREAEAFSGDISFWNTSKVKNFDLMFKRSENFDIPLNTWDVSGAESMEEMFRFSFYNQDLSNWNVSRVTNLRNMFADNDVFNQSLCAWGSLLPSDADVAFMFRASSCITEDDPNMTRTPPGPFCHPCS